MNAQENFEKLKKLLSEAVLLRDAAALLEWAKLTNCPPLGHKSMGEKKALIERLAHEAFVREEIGGLLQELETQKSDLERAEKLLVERLLFSYKRAEVLSADFVERKSLITSESNVAWVKAKKSKNFSVFAPYFQRVIELLQEEAMLYGGQKGNGSSLYTALFQTYEPGMTTERADEVLRKVRGWLIPFIQRIKSSPEKAFNNDEELANKILKGIFPKDRQKALCEALLRTIGYDFRCGHLAETIHPFSIPIGPGDFRVTTNYVEDTLSAALFSTVHEGGHSFFDRGRNPMLDWANVSDFIVSMGIHESQSRMWENIVCRSPYFWIFFYPILQAIFPEFYEVGEEDFLRAINVVKPSPIRIYADEVTYNLHILVRFEVEIALLSGDLRVEDFPEVFANKMAEYIGCKPKDVSEGAIQDVHFSLGYIGGYFPTYAFGNLAAAQLFAKFTKDCPDWKGHFMRGKFNVLLNWLRDEVHHLGHLETLDGMLQRVTGEPLSPKYWFEYIEEKYTQLYKLSGPTCKVS